jgi:clan AA aspartic protease
VIRTNLIIENPFFQGTSREVDALVDTGASFCVIPQKWVEDLYLKKIGKVESELADGSKVKLDRVIGLQVTFEGRTAVAAALVGGNEFILGLEAMQQMDVICSPSHKKLVVNPSHPDMPGCIMKGHRCS